MPRGVPPGPPSGWLGLRQSKEIRRDFIGFGARLHKEFGDVVHFRLGPQACYLLVHPEHVQEVLVRQGKKFRKAARFKRVFGRLHGAGLVTGDGGRWAGRRRVVQPAFQPARIADYAGAVVRLTDEMTAAWPEQEEIDFAAEMRRLTLRIVARALFSASVDSHTLQIEEAVDEIQRWGFGELNRVIATPGWLPLIGRPKARRAFKLLNDLVGRIIRERRGSAIRHADLLGHLLDAPGLSDRDVRQEVVSFLVAGHETVAVALTWAGSLFARHPGVQSRMADAAAKVFGGSGPDFTDSAQLATIEQAFRETVRLYPPVYLFSREVAEPAVIGGYAMSPGSQVFLSPYLTQRDARWFPDPDTFDPLRFTPESEGSRPACSWFPFGAGPHACVGRGFALSEATLILARIVRRYCLEPVHSQKDPEPEARLLLRPNGGLRLTVRRHGLG